MNMKTNQKIKQQVYREVEASGFLKNIQASVKAHVLDLIDKDTQNNKNQLGFQYEHPLLSKLKKYPLTSLCMDLIQEFLESFKFQHTLNVFKKEINRKNKMERIDLAQQFKIEIKNPQSQAVLLTIVSQLFHGDITVKPTTQVRKNNFINQNINNNQAKTNQSNEKKIDGSGIGKPSVFNQNPKQNQPEKQKKIDEPIAPKKVEVPKDTTTKQKPVKQQIANDSNISSSVEEQSSYQRNAKLLQQKRKLQQQKKKEKAEKETSTALLADITGKFGLNKKKQKTPDQQYQARRIFSEPKEKKAPPPQSGINKIRGASVGKSMNSFLTKFSSIGQNKNQSSYVDEEMDEFQQSKDSTRKNPLFSSTESGFDKSGFDESVSDSYAIDNYQYVEKAKKMGKK